MKARFTAQFTVPIDLTGSRAKKIRTFKGHFSVDGAGADLTSALAGVLHGLAREENLEGVTAITVRVSLRHKSAA